MDAGSLDAGGCQPCTPPATLGPFGEDCRVSADFLHDVDSGSHLDPMKINLLVGPCGDVASQQAVPFVGDPCETGWHWDDEDHPTTLVLCPATCAAVVASHERQVCAMFGCATVCK